MLRLFVASIAGVISFFPTFWLATWITGDNNIGAWSALPVAFIAVPVLVLRLWRSQGDPSRRNLVFGVIGIVWGGLILISGPIRGGYHESGAFGQGMSAGLVFGGLLFVAGLYYFIKGKRIGQETESKADAG
jgi:hypothetical protein